MYDSRQKSYLVPLAGNGKNDDDTYTKRDDSHKKSLEAVHDSSYNQKYKAKAAHATLAMTQSYGLDVRSSVWAETRGFSN